MARKQRQILSIAFTPQARADWFEIWTWNVTTYGEFRATQYLKRLTSELEKLAQNPQIGTGIDEFEGVRMQLVQRRTRSHGHRIFYRFDTARLQVLRVLHTAQDWQTKLSDE